MADSGAGGRQIIGPTTTAPFPATTGADNVFPGVLCVASLYALKNPASLQLRYLQTLLELGADQNSTVVFPLPVDIITPFLKNAAALEDIAGSLNDRR